MRVPIKRLTTLILFASTLIATSIHSAKAGAQPNQTKGLVYIPSGFYSPFRKVEGRIIRITSFYMRKDFVSNQEFLEFVKANPEWRRSKIKRIFADKYYLMNWANDTTLNSESKQGVHPSAPVTFVSWFAARAFCHWKKVQLPSFDELQYALETLARRNSHPGHNKVSSSNHDVLWEWIEDVNSLSVVMQKSNVESDLSLPLCAAGAYGFNSVSDYERFKRLAYLSSIKPNYCEPNLSFRWVIKLSK